MWLVVPAVTVGTYAVIDAQVKDSGASTPAAVALWATVSADVDRRMTASLAEPIRLQAQDWRSGNIPWLVEAIDEPHALR